MFFAKMDAIASQITAVSLGNTNFHFIVRRIILENNKAYQGNNDNNNLYFCGFTTESSGDMIFGNLVSNDLTSLTIS